MGSHHLNLKWRNHHSNLLSVFSQLLTSEAFADVTLACDGASLRAHKLILSACSPFFHSLFAQHPCQHPIVILKDVPYDDLKVLVDFMYHGEVNIAQERLPSFLRTAEALKVKGLSESEAHNRIGPMKSFNTTSNSHQKSTTEKRYAPGMSSKPAYKKPKRSDNGQELGQSMALALPGPLALTSDKVEKSPSHDSNINSDTAEVVEPKTENLTPRNEDSHDGTMPLDPEHADGEGAERITADGSMLQVLPQTSDASSSDNILEVESYRQLQRMAGLLAYSRTSSPSRPQFGFNLPAYSGRIPNEEDEDDDDDDKDSSEPGKVDETEDCTPAEDVHELTKLPRHKKKDCIVCGNRAAGLRRRSRQWCPGCNVGVHVHCFEKLVHFRRHPRRSRSEPNSAQLTTLPHNTLSHNALPHNTSPHSMVTHNTSPHNTLQHSVTQQLALPFTTSYTKIT